MLVAHQDLCPWDVRRLLGPKKWRKGCPFSSPNQSCRRGSRGIEARNRVFQPCGRPLLVVFAKVVDVDPVTTDRYGRTVAFVTVGDTVVNEELIPQGLAWVFIRYCDRAIYERWNSKL